MSFVPNPQQANAANAKNANVTSAQAASAAGTSEEAPISDAELLFKTRTFDVFWVDKQALMYKDGIAKVRRILRALYQGISQF
jgi:murein L,D-transpeptidase YcbB/YkuD